MSKHAICIGAQKAGTSWLFRCLQEHPDISCAKQKETHYFSVYFTNNPDDYRQLFDPAKKIWFEASTSYLAEPEALERIYEFDQQAKLIVVLRDPVERAYSHYLHLQNANKLSHQNLEQALEEHPRIIAYSSYGAALRRYLERFPRKQILIINFNSIASRPQAVLDCVCRFLAIDNFTPSLLNHKYHSTEARSNRNYKKIAHLYGSWNQYKIGRMFINLLRNLGVNHLLVDRVLQRVSKKKQTLTPDERTLLQNKLAADKKIFDSLTLTYDV